MKSAHADTPQGFAFAMSAYFLWGFLPIYMKALAEVTPLEVLAHRVVWSIPIAAIVLVALGRTKDLRAALMSPRTLAMGAVTAALISANWGIYIWSIFSGKALEAALGYYINPLFSVFLGALLLGERLDKIKWAAMALALAAVIILTVESGSVPIVALALTGTWGFYAYFKRSLPIGPNQGFLLEVLLLSVPALGFIAYLAYSGTGHFMMGSAPDTWLLIGCGVVTAVPLMLYANGAKLLRLSTIGMLQYIAPTMIFLIAVFVFGEQFGRARMIAFPMIWCALALYSYALWKETRLARA
ncbi:EamA family transporter RarD [Roseobacter denitrificans]|uniref:RarD protein, putative n=2 Tax=Roseobacter denitrificans TaxID=2434 RepID=Q16B68_ROSDO|nr:EamA family transporter RarD [Roseobacter denitrificans]ABG30775.1 rarD protein, putative [Roseobacter denitrificans OCh 114]SFG46933.1 chloramphenicol-sensitive protein RarD [Roseobacter denitrificans OCh 114]